MLKLQLWLKSNIKMPKPPEQIKVEPSIAMVKDLLADNIDGHVIYFYDMQLLILLDPLLRYIGLL